MIDDLISLCMIQLWKRFRGEDKPPPHLGSSKDYNIDMNPKVIYFPCFLLLLLIHVHTTYRHVMT